MSWISVFLVRSLSFVFFLVLVMFVICYYCYLYLNFMSIFHGFLDLGITQQLIWRWSGFRQLKQLLVNLTLFCKTCECLGMCQIYYCLPILLVFTPTLTLLDWLEELLAVPYFQCLLVSRNSFAMPPWFFYCNSAYSLECCSSTLSLGVVLFILTIMHSPSL